MAITTRQVVREVELTIPREGLARLLSVVAGLLLVAHLLVSLNRYVFGLTFFAADNLYVLFDMWEEVSIPSWYSVALLLVAAGVLTIIASGTRAASDPYARHWTALAVIFLTLSIDDAADVHGHTSYTLREVFDTSGFLAYAWIIPAAALVALVGLAYLRFLLHLPSPVRRQFVIAAALFLAGALLLAAIEGRYDTQHGVENMPYRLMVGVEETLEMAGIILFISTLLGYLASMGKAVRLRVRPD
ncbi:hypothetical protein [Azohydromonas sp.]|uniref:hypothetical protein n=1 Tax=Azohydromonas sp. TaxID=1872666 RepID=UPI002C17C311|nr:hypothetical protein [Azohydromonas sp.]HMM83827.1 hypothetical protein [Azohydromonas sp.]